MAFDAEKMRQIEEARKNQGFLKRNAMWFYAIAGLTVLHIVWYKVVEEYVDEKEKPKYPPYTVMRRLDPFRNAESKK